MIFLIIAISLLGLLLFALLIRGIKQANEARTLKRHRSKQAGVADLLNYGSMIDDGIILCKNGSLMAAYVYAGKDKESHTERQQEFDAELLNAALTELGNGWMIHVDAVRSPAPKYPSPDLSHFPDPISRAIDTERRHFFEERGVMYEGYSVLTVTWFPPMLAQAKFVDLMFDDAQAPTSAKERGQKILTGFKKDLKSLENRLSTVLSLTRLTPTKMKTAPLNTMMSSSPICSVASPENRNPSVSPPAPSIWTCSSAGRNCGEASFPE